ncbi:hypothetical protein KIL84_009157 [Mauremys mutica]|uniref:Uncharacterized protein n=1 Tax=Mauremys mutica TaxID=74926 RepID=A0A9D3XIS4_9SAUR|nr:hypothetical protein KIL84_009157 [Mauremys mutica]
MEPMAGSSSGASSQELSSTPEVSSQSQKLHSDVAFRGIPDTPVEHLCQRRKCPRRSKEDMFQELLQYSDAEKRERMEWREIERQDRKENEAFIKDATERIIKVMEEQTEMLKSLIMRVHPPLQHTQNSFPCRPETPLVHSFLLFGTSRFSIHSMPMDTFSNDSWTYAQL